MTPVSSKLDSIRAWSVNTYKFTRQVISERLGKGSRTVDLDLEGQIESLRDTQRKYANILHLARALSNHFYHVVQTQRSLGDTFASMSQKSPELQEEFSYNAETQKALCKNGEALIGKQQITYHSSHIEAWSKWLAFCRQIFQMHFSLMENFDISLKFVRNWPIYRKSSLVQVLAQ